METKELRGDALARDIRNQVRTEAKNLRSNGIEPRLAAVLTDSDPAGLSYAESKAKVAEKLGVSFELVRVSPDEGQEGLEKILDKLAADPAVHGIMLEFPLASGLDAGLALDRIPAHKDVDGLTATNLGLLYMGRGSKALVSATAQACVMLAEVGLSGDVAAADSEYGLLEGVRVGVVGKGRTVGTPLIGMLLNRRATVTVCHSLTADLGAALRDCDVVFAAVGKPGLLNKGNLQEGQILIDAGITVVDGSVRGDVDADSVRGFSAALTPVPQGVGPLTTALIFKNLMRAIQLK